MKVVDRADGGTGDAANVVGAVKGSLEDVAVEGVVGRVDDGGVARDLASWTGGYSATCKSRCIFIFLAYCIWWKMWHDM